MKKYIFILIILIIHVNSSFIFSQSQWVVLNNSPVAVTRFNDCSFINPNTGWICNADSQEIYKTTNGGVTWFVVGLSNTTNRCIAFFDSLRGFVGEYNSANRMNKTTDGGATWQALTIPAPASTGLCGFSVVNASVIYGCGRYWGPARVVKSTDGGVNWSNIDMSSYASGLVDCYFTSPDSGIVVGRSASPSKGIVLVTYDGGINWDTTYITTNIYQWGWKISFPTKNTGYVSLEPAGAIHSFFLKTTNGGINWEEKIFLGGQYDEEGIGFVNSSTGWIGGWESITYETTNGGDSWYPMTDVGEFRNINRYRFFGDSIGYAVGKRVYKYQSIMTNINVNQGFEISDYKLYQNYPNPFNPRTNIKIELPQGADVRISIFDVLGNEVCTLIEGDYLSAGTYEFSWDASAYSSGVYYYKIFTKDFESSNRMVLIK